EPCYSLVQVIEGNVRRVNNIAYVLRYRRLEVCDLQLDHLRQRVALACAVVKSGSFLVEFRQLDKQVAEQRVVYAKGRRRNDVRILPGLKALQDVLIILQFDLQVRPFRFQFIKVVGQRLGRSTDVDHIASSAE